MLDWSFVKEAADGHGPHGCSARAAASLELIKVGLPRGSLPGNPSRSLSQHLLIAAVTAVTAVIALLPSPTGFSLRLRLALGLEQQPRGLSPDVQRICQLCTQVVTQAQAHIYLLRGAPA